MTDDQLERELDSLKATLLVPEPVPLGLAARLEAAVARAMGTSAGARIGWEPRLVIACLVFAIAWAFAGPDGTVAFAAIAAVVAVAYAAVAIGPAGAASE